MEGLAFGFRKIKQAAAKAGRLEGQLENVMDPGNIRDAEIDTYLRDYHAGNAPKASTFKPLPDRYEKVAMMEPVAKITGKEFDKGAVNLPDQVTAYFDSLGGIVHNSQLGDIEISRRGVKDSMAHGIRRKKSAAFAVVPEVLTQGEIIDYQPNWKNRGYETCVIAAPLTIAGTMRRLPYCTVHCTNSHCKPCND